MKNLYYKVNSIIVTRFSRVLILSSILLTMNSCFENSVIVPECDPCTSPSSYVGFTKIFEEDFNSTVLSNSWGYFTGNGCPSNCGFGTGELQLYQSDNVTLRDGNLVITAKKETIGSNLYTSGRISTFDSLSFTYGRIDVRAKLPKGQGLWPAVWLLGDNINEVGWPTAGQIFLLQMRGGVADNRDNTINGGLTWGENSIPKFVRKDLSLKNGIFNDKFHVFSLVWDASKIQWLLNDKVYFEQKLDASMNGTFNKPFHLVLNLAVGGRFPGDPDATTIFPQELVIDYIRVFQK
jgi:beta-glucanase (GH16 family)